MATNRLKRVGVAGLMAGIAALLILYLFGAFSYVRPSGQQGGMVAEMTSTTTPTTQEAVTVEPTAAPTEEPTEAPTEAPLPTQAPTEEPTVEPTIAPTEEPTEAPTQAPTETPAPEVQTTWLVVEADTDQPLNQVLVKLKFNQDDPTQEFWTNESGEIEIVLDQAPSLGQNEFGYATFWAHGTDLELTGLQFRLDPSSRSLVLLDQDGQDLRGPVRLYPHEQSEPPEDWEDSPVWPECADVECATEIAATSPYFRSDETVTCHEDVLDSPRGTWQSYRAANGMSVVAPTMQDPNFVGPGWPDGGEVSGWQCGTEGERIFVVSGCGNIAIAVPRE